MKFRGGEVGRELGHEGAGLAFRGHAATDSLVAITRTAKHRDC